MNHRRRHGHALRRYATRRRARLAREWEELVRLWAWTQAFRAWSMRSRSPTPYNAIVVRGDDGLYDFLWWDTPHHATATQPNHQESRP